MSPAQAEHEAWWAFVRAIRDWRQRNAPSVGARAIAITRNRGFLPSELRQIEDALNLYLSKEQLSEREPDLSYFRRAAFDARRYTK